MFPFFPSLCESDEADAFRGLRDHVATESDRATFEALATASDLMASPPIRRMPALPNGCHGAGCRVSPTRYGSLVEPAPLKRVVAQGSAGRKQGADLAGQVVARGFYSACGATRLYPPRAERRQEMPEHGRERGAQRMASLRIPCVTDYDITRLMMQEFSDGLDRFGGLRHQPLA